MSYEHAAGFDKGYGEAAGPRDAEIAKLQARITDLEDKNAKLQDSQALWQDSDRIWHHCVKGIRAYRAELCSAHPGVEGLAALNFNAPTEYRKLREENEQLRAALEEAEVFVEYDQGTGTYDRRAAREVKKLRERIESLLDRRPPLNPNETDSKEGE